LEEADWRTLARFSLPSEPGAERQAIQEVVEAIQDLGLPKSRLERLKTAVGETTMNAIEHGNKYRPELWVSIHVRASEDAIMIEVSDEGSGSPAVQPPKPDLEAKIAGRQSPRGWGLFLIENMVDQMNVIQDKAHHTVELVLFRNGESDGNNPV
jgi:anti-sigma regulatory factor (Ser/Thr protein kinase)